MVPQSSSLEFGDLEGLRADLVFLDVEGAIESIRFEVLHDELDGLVAGHLIQLVNPCLQLHQLLPLPTVLLPQASIVGLQLAHSPLQPMNFLFEVHLFEVNQLVL